MCYASNFGGVEKYGDHCDTFFEEDDFEKITSENVRRELKRVEKRRVKLYASIIDSLRNEGNLSGVEAGNKISNHLRAIIESVDKGKIEPTVSNFRSIELFFRTRCRNAVVKKIKEIINVEREYEKRYPGRRHEKLNWDQLLGVRIGNLDDGKIVMDCAVLSSFRGHLIFVTADQKDILGKKEEILSFVNDYCSIVSDLQDPDFEIHHIADLVNCYG